MSHPTKPHEEIEHDLQIVEAMAVEMPQYLRFEGVYYPLFQANFPRLTLGGYLMRQHRLLALGDKLDTLTADRLSTAVTRFQDSAAENLVQVEQHANEELQVRLRQWDSYLKELAQNPYEYEAYYTTHVKDRVILKSILEFMQPPYKPDAQVTRELDSLDFTLHNKWQEGDFIWLSVWKPAYPRQEYWWLYGRPTPTDDEPEGRELTPLIKQVEPDE